MSEPNNKLEQLADKITSEMCLYARLSEKGSLAHGFKAFVFANLAEVSRLIVEAAGRATCHYCEIGNVPHFNHKRCGHDWQHTVNGEEICCDASNLRALLPQETAEEKNQ